MKSFRLDSSVRAHWATVLIGWSVILGVFFGLFHVVGLENWSANNPQWYLIARADAGLWTRSFYVACTWGAGIGLLLGTLHLWLRRVGALPGTIQTESTDPTEREMDVVAEKNHSSKRRILLLLFGYFVFFGAACCFLPDDDQVLDFVSGLVPLVLGIWWCFVDARERDFRIGQLTRLALILAFVIGFPLYLFQSRGIRGLRTLIACLAVVGAAVACGFATEFLILVTGDALGLWRFVNREL